MKKKIFSLLLTIFLLMGCSSSKLSKLTLDELNKKIENKETFIVYFYKSDSKLEETLNDVLESNNLEGFKVDTSKITNEEKNKLQFYPI